LIAFDFAAVYRHAAANLKAVDDEYIRTVEQATDLLERAYRAGGKVLVFGNGGSSADAQHIAAELVGRFALARAPLAAVALTTNQALLTAWSNDAGYDDAFARELRALGREGDVAWGISTSGNSPSVVNALMAARELGLHTIGLTSARAVGVREHCDVLMAAAATDTPRIQELHLVTYHAICAALEQRLFGGGRA
jgi:D-sedoheptulose 7-phosphate isomerase